MVRKICGLAMVLAWSLVYTGCAENEHKVTSEKQEQHESAPQDSSPGQMVVE